MTVEPRFRPTGNGFVWGICEVVGPNLTITHPWPPFKDYDDAKRAVDEWNAYDEQEERSSP